MEVSNLARIQEGKSTKLHVRAAVGNPNRVIPNTDGGETWEYLYYTGRISPMMYVPLVGNVVAASGKGVTDEGHTLLVVFDKRGVVQKIEAGKTERTHYQLPFQSRTTTKYESKPLPSQSNEQTPVTTETPKPSPVTEKAWYNPKFKDE